MWPLKQSSRHFVRVGRVAVEHWAPAEGGLMLAASVALPVDAPREPEQLVPAVQALFSATPVKRTTLLLESAWMPVMLVDTGATLWSARQVEALLRHQIGLLYGDGPETVSTWILRLLHRAGDRYALGYGLSPRVLQAALDCAKTLGVAWEALLPASAWGWQRLQPYRRWPARTGWWVWPEQERNLLVRADNKRWVGLHAGVAPGSDSALIEQAVAAECVRLGVLDAGDPIAVAHWHDMPATTGTQGRISWQSVSRPMPESLRDSQPSVVLAS